MINWRKLNLGLEIGKIYQRFCSESSIGLSWFCFHGTASCYPPFEKDQLAFRSQSPSFLLAAETQLPKSLFPLSAFGYGSDLYRPTHTTCEHWRCVSVYRNAFSSDGCLATCRSFAPCPWISPTGPSPAWAVLLIVPPYLLPFLLLKSAHQVPTHELSTSSWCLSPGNVMLV